VKVRAFPNSSGSRYWRLEDPFKALRKRGIDAQVVEGGITEAVANEADIYVLQGTIDKDGLALLYEYQQERGKKIVIDADDFPELNPDNPHQIEHDLTDALPVITRMLEVADLVTTTTQHLAYRLRDLNNNVKVLPNLMDLERWDLPKRHNTSPFIRIGWAGSITHLDDLKLLVTPLTRICREFPHVQLIFVGDLRARSLFPDCQVEVMAGVAFEQWPAKLNTLALDIGLAPLRDTPFNRCKSNIKWLEYAIAQVPGIFSPMVYQYSGFEPKFGHIAYNDEQWYQAIKMLIQFPQLRAEAADSSYQLVKHKFDLGRGIHKWEDAYQGLVDTK